MDRHAESDRHQIKKHMRDSRGDMQLGKRHDDHHAAQERVKDAIETELLRGNGELAVDRQCEEGVQFSGPDQLGDIGNVDEEKRLEQLRDHLVGADQQDHLPLCPITEAVDLAKDDAEESDLAAKPKDFHDHPEDKVCFETQLPDERVAQHDSPDGEITAHAWNAFLRSRREVNLPPRHPERSAAESKGLRQALFESQLLDWLLHRCRSVQRGIARLRCRFVGMTGFDRATSPVGGGCN